VCDAEYYLQILCGCLSPGSAVGQGLRPFVVYPPSCPFSRFSDQATGWKILGSNLEGRDVSSRKYPASYSMDSGWKAVESWDRPLTSI